MPTIYCADIYCDRCGEAIEKDLRATGHKPPDYAPPWDSSDWPTHNLCAGETDSPDHCGAHAQCLEAETLPSSRKIGALLGTDLTEDGVRYVLEAVEEGGEVAEFWKEQFDWIDFPEDEATP